VGVAALVAFGALYIWSFLVVRIHRRTGQRTGWRHRSPCSSGAIALTVVEALTAGESALAMGVVHRGHGAVLAPAAAGALAVFATVVAACGHPAVRRPGWHGTTAAWSSARSPRAWRCSASCSSCSGTCSSAAAREEIADLAVIPGARPLRPRPARPARPHADRDHDEGRARRPLAHCDPDRAAAEIADVERLARDALADVRATVARLPGGVARRTSSPRRGSR
jgi:two-component system sensor histidine kinase DesK